MSTITPTEPELNRFGRRHPEVMTRHEVVEYLRLSLAAVAARTASGEIPSFTIGRRRLYRRTDLDAWIAGRIEGGS